MQIIISQLKEMYEQLELLDETLSPRKEFIVEDIIHFGKSMKRIDMNPFSLSLVSKSFLFTNSGAIFFSALINFFQQLETSTEDHRVCYNSYSHSKSQK